MIPLLSICIPTMNRPEWLLHALNSIFAGDVLGEIEICISNNCSESDYLEVEKKLEVVTSLNKIRYVRHNSRLSLDENMLFVKQMASADFIYFLGDDDYFLRDQINELVQLVKIQKPDLAIFNGILVDGNNNYLGMHFNLPPKEYQTLEEAYLDLKDKGTFGAVLVHRDLLQDEDFRQLNNTDHAYGCYWLSIFRKFEEGKIVKIIIPDFPCVALRCAHKNYNHINVYYKTIPNWMAICMKLVGQGMPLKLLIDYDLYQYQKIASIRFLLSMSNLGNDLDLIKVANPLFYKKHEIKIKICKIISSSIFYKLYKMYKIFYRKHIKQKTIYDSVEIPDNIKYLITPALQLQEAEPTQSKSPSTR